MRFTHSAHGTSPKIGERVTVLLLHNRYPEVAIGDVTFLDMKRIEVGLPGFSGPMSIPWEGDPDGVIAIYDTSAKRIYYNASVMTKEPVPSRLGEDFPHDYRLQCPRCDGTEFRVTWPITSKQDYENKYFSHDGFGLMFEDAIFTCVNCGIGHHGEKGDLEVVR